MAVTASVQPESDWIAYMPDPASCIRFIFLSFKEGIDHSVQNRTGSDLDGLVRCWFNASGLEASWCTGIIWPGSGKTQPAHYQFPTFRLSCVLPQMAQFILCKASLDPVWFWLHASGLESSQCARFIRPGSGRMQPARYKFSTFRLSCILPQTASVTLCKASLDPIWFQLNASSFGQMDLVWRQAGMQESPVNTSSNQCFQADLAQMQFRSGMFAGDIRRT